MLRYTSTLLTIVTLFAVVNASTVTTGGTGASGGKGTTGGTGASGGKGTSGGTGGIAPTGVPGGVCPTGVIYCCDSISPSVTTDIIEMADNIGMSVSNLQGYVGSTCNPFSGIAGVGNSGGECPQQPLCCLLNYWNGVAVIGCSPISIDL